MPWLETDVEEQRLQFVLAVTRPGANRAAVCAAFGLSRKTGYKWLRRHLQEGVRGLANQSRRPHHQPRRTPAAITAQVGAARAQFGWGGEKLAVVLQRAGVAVSARTIDRLIQREGWTRRDAAPAAARRRFEHGAPNALWQLDAKGAYPVPPQGRCHPLSVIDDHSRYVVGLAALPALTRAVVQPVLVRCFETYGLPQAMLMDHGTPWWDAGHAAGLTQLGVFLIDQGIRVIHGRVRHPQTQGKVERFHRTLAERLRWVGVPTTLAAFVTTLAWFRGEYNEVRPHEARGLEPPAWHYRPSPRAYQPQPRPWEYAPGTDVRRVDGTGSVTYEGRRFFVSEALIDARVSCLRIGTRVLVRYRNRAVREWCLTTGRSVSVVAPRARRPGKPASAAQTAAVAASPGP